jgi:hypothetical protein
VTFGQNKVEGQSEGRYAKYSRHGLDIEAGGILMGGGEYMRLCHKMPLAGGNVSG